MENKHDVSISEAKYNVFEIIDIEEKLDFASNQSCCFFNGSCDSGSSTE